MDWIHNLPKKLPCAVSALETLGFGLPVQLHLGGSRFKHGLDAMKVQLAEIPGRNWGADLDDLMVADNATTIGALLLHCESILQLAKNRNVELSIYVLKSSSDRRVTGYQFGVGSQSVCVCLCDELWYPVYGLLEDNELEEQCDPNGHEACVISRWVMLAQLIPFPDKFGLEEEQEFRALMLETLRPFVSSIKISGRFKDAAAFDLFLRTFQALLSMEVRHATRFRAELCAVLGGRALRACKSFERSQKDEWLAHIPTFLRLLRSHMGREIYRQQCILHTAKEIADELKLVCD